MGQETSRNRDADGRTYVLVCYAACAPSFTPNLSPKSAPRNAGVFGAGKNLQAPIGQASGDERGQHGVLKDGLEEEACLDRQPYRGHSHGDPSGLLYINVNIMN